VGQLAAAGFTSLGSEKWDSGWTCWVHLGVCCREDRRTLMPTLTLTQLL
jgi:hypothetical protein